MKKNVEYDEKTHPNDQTTPGRVKQICQNFVLYSDAGLAHRLQQEEYTAHFNRNRAHRQESRLGTKAARDVEEQEKQTFMAKQFETYHQRRKTEEHDIALARKLQEEMKIEQLDSTDRTTSSTYNDSIDDQSFYEEIDPSTAFDNTIGDEQLARILQEEEELLFSARNTHFDRATF